MLWFAFVYVATLLGLLVLDVPFIQSGFVAVSLATVAAVTLVERGRWNVGLFVPPPLALREFALGNLGGALLIGTGALAIVLLTDVRHVPGRGFPWTEVLLLYLPAVFHEELLFRGYAFQKLHQHSRWPTLIGFALVFAWLHGGNTAVTTLGLINIFVGGIVLGVAYELYGRLWFPIGLHLAWNVMSGPILGHEVSGWESMETVFAEAGTGPELLTGGEFGIEGSVVLTLLELALIVILNMMRARRVTLQTKGVSI